MEDGVVWTDTFAFPQDEHFTVGRFHTPYYDRWQGQPFAVEEETKVARVVQVWYDDESGEETRRENSPGFRPPIGITRKPNVF